MDSSSSTATKECVEYDKLRDLPIICVDSLKEELEKLYAN